MSEEASGSVKNDLENVVAELEEIERIQFPYNYRLNGNFLVANDTVFAQSFHGPVEVHSVKNGEKLTSLSFRMHEVGGENAMASDGKYLYFNLRKNFELRDSDVLLARFPKDAGKYQRTEFVGKSIGELRVYELILHNSNRAGISSRIVSVPLEMLSKPSEIWDTEALLDSGNRFLLTHDMGLCPLLFSGHGFVALHYKSDPECVGLCDSSLYFKNGELFLPKKGELEKIYGDYSKRSKIPLNVRVELYRPKNQITASNNVRFWDELEHGEDEARFPMPVVIKNTAIQGEEILSLRHNDDIVYVLTARRNYDGEREGITYVTKPHELITYQVSLRKLIPLEKTRENSSVAG